MGFIRKTPAGRFQAVWRDPAGRQRAKNFILKKDASRYLRSVESAKATGAYIDPRSADRRFLDVATAWLEGYVAEPTTVTRVKTALRSQVLPEWGETPIGRITYLDVAAWVRRLGETLAPATVTKALQVLSMVMESACRSRIIPDNPCRKVRIQGGQRPVRPGVAITRDDFAAVLGAIPPDRRLLPALAGYCGLRWGEAAGLAWSGVDLDAGLLVVRQVAVEISGAVAIRSYPKTTSGVRRVPVPAPLMRMLEDAGPGDGRDLVCPTATGSPFRRANFRKQVWRPALVRAGLLGELGEVRTGEWEAVWTTSTGDCASAVFATEREAVAAIVARHSGGLRFHDLRHSYTTWLVSAGIPVNVVQRLVGHAQVSTTLNRYTHHLDDDKSDVRGIFAD